jgi:hypothetical protein
VAGTGTGDDLHFPCEGRPRERAATHPASGTAWSSPAHRRSAGLHIQALGLGSGSGGTGQRGTTARCTWWRESRPTVGQEGRGKTEAVMTGSSSPLLNRQKDGRGELDLAPRCLLSPDPSAGDAWPGVGSCAAIKRRPGASHLGTGEGRAPGRRRVCSSRGHDGACGLSLAG